MSVMFMAACGVASHVLFGEFDPMDPPCHKTNEVKVGVYPPDLGHPFDMNFYLTIKWIDDRNYDYGPDYRRGTSQPGWAI